MLPVRCSKDPEEIGNTYNFPFRRFVGCDAAQIGYVHSIHADYQVEIPEVFPSDLPADMCQIQSAAPCMLAHTVIGQISDVIIAGAAGVYGPSSGIGLVL